MKDAMGRLASVVEEEKKKMVEGRLKGARGKRKRG